MLQQLFSNLNSPDSVTREDALRDVSALPPTARLQLFQMVARSYSSVRIKSGPRMVIMAITALLLFAGLEHRFGGIGPALLALGVGVGGYHAWQNPMMRARQQLVVLGQGLDDVRFVLPLLQLLYGPDEDRPDPQLADILRRLLPQMRARNMAHWTPGDRALLLRLLNQRHNAELTLAVLKALEQVGDTTAIPTVERLANLSPPEFRFPEDARIREAAVECLTFLNTWTEVRREERTLLRSSGAATANPDQLLHPVQSAGDPERPDELLRPGERGNLSV